MEIGQPARLMQHNRGEVSPTRIVETGAGMRKDNNVGTPPTAEELKKSGAAMHGAMEAARGAIREAEEKAKREADEAVRREAEAKREAEEAVRCEAEEATREAEKAALREARKAERRSKMAPI